MGAVAELLGDTGDVMNQNVGIRIQGKSARERWDKRFTLVARKEFGGSPVFDTVLYDGVLTHSVMLKSQLPDAIIGDLASDRAVALQGSIPVSLYLNGEHWYDCYMLERYDEQLRHAMTCYLTASIFPEIYYLSEHFRPAHQSQPKRFWRSSLGRPWGT